MNPSSSSAEARPTSSPSSPMAEKAEEGGEIVTQLTENDVLLGRGVEHTGNVKFRRIISGRRAEYLSVKKRQHKDRISRQVMSAVAKQGGRFLRRIESLVEAEQLGIPAGTTAWRVADETSILQKIKQALRERESGQHQHQQMDKRPAAAGVEAEYDVSPRPTKKHQASADTSIQQQQPEVLPPLEMQQASRTGVVATNTAPFSAPSTMKSPMQTNLLSGTSFEGYPTSEALNTTLLRERLQQQQQQQSIHRPAAQSTLPQLGLPQDMDSEQARRLHQRSLTNELLSTIVRTPTSSGGGRSYLDSLLALLPQSSVSSPPPPPGGAASLASGNQFYRQSPTTTTTGTTAATTALGDSDLAALSRSIQGSSVHTSNESSSLLPNNDRMLAVLAAMRGLNDTTQPQQQPPGSFPSTPQDERVIPLRQTQLIGDVGTIPLQRLQQQQQQSSRLIPSFFPEDLRAETKAIVALYESTNLDRKTQGSVYLSFSLIEMLILAVLCSFGIPTWSPSKLDRGEVFSPMKKTLDDVASATTSYHISWYDFSLLLQEAAKDWRDRRTLHGIITNSRSDSLANAENRAIDICASYTSDTRQLAKTALCILEKVRSLVEAMKGTKTTGLAVTSPPPAASDPGTSEVSKSWMEQEIKLWAKTLDCQTTGGFPVAYTVSDFLLSHAQYKDNNAFMLISHCDHEVCQAVWSQIVRLSHTRSMATAVPSVDGLSARLERGLMNKNSQSWLGMPRWWSLNTSYFDLELLKILLLDGYVGVLSAPLSSLPAAASLRSPEPMTFSKLGIVSKRLLNERFEQLAQLLADTEGDESFMEQLQQPRNQKCLDERVQSFRSLA